MAWICAQCKTSHDDAFDSCWQCGAQLTFDSPTAESLVVDYDEEVLQRTPEEEAVERAALDAAGARFAHEARIRGDPSVYGRYGFLVRVQHGRACYHARQHHPTAPPRADLDWLWAIAFAGGCASAAGAGMWWFGWNSLVVRQIAMYAIIAGVIVGLAAAQWAAGREISAAERGGWEPDT